VIASSRREYQAEYSPDGLKVAFVSDRSGDSEVWVANADGSNPAQLTSQRAIPTAPQWSPDGKRLAFAQRPGGNTDVYVIDAQNGAPKRMTTDPGNDASAYWSRDGKWIYFASNRTGRQEVWKMPSGGPAKEVQMTRNGGWRSTESEDGKILYFQKFDQPGLFRMPVGGGAEEKVTDVAEGQPWELSGTVVYYFHPTGQRRRYAVHRVDLASLKETEVLLLPEGASGGTSNFSVSPEGRWLLFVKVDQSVGDLMMIESFR
jgi:Tol biopolymer transport system component